MLLAEALRLDVDVLCWGGGAFDAFEYGGRFFVRPGSATGCGGWEGEGEGGTPSFCLMDVSARGFFGGGGWGGDGANMWI